MNKKREDVQKHVFKVLNSISPNNRNIKYYQEFFDGMSDKQFDEWMINIRDGNTKLYYNQPNGPDAKGDFLNKDRLLDTAKKFDIKLEQHISIWDNIQKRYYTTPHKYLVVKIPVRRLKQYLLSKLSVSESDRRINPVTGQVVKPDKSSSISMTEAQTIASKKLYNCLTEDLNVRGGNVDAYAKFKDALENNGSVDLKDLNLEKTEVRSVNYVNACFKAMHLDSNF